MLPYEDVQVAEDEIILSKIIKEECASFGNKEIQVPQIKQEDIVYHDVIYEEIYATRWIYQKIKIQVNILNRKSLLKLLHNHIILVSHINSSYHLNPQSN